ncbi:DUF2933 domain-containing protein [Nocardioides sp. J2M5]|uniref:DUF2933 domain-containing protein n=1 Tax=Nocardioides palaemonis TaxID=2829810 RepID=UPI001BAACCA8|nr:DUF2933 domain-containing protein [Nocardioides palaemonis]MBS2938882.1 DUF2933 domain-containing protein [Nocardioides palaemonis]
MNTNMTRSPNLGLYAVAAAIAIVGALWVGVPAGTLAFVGIALICPLVMMVMMGGMMGMHHGGSNDSSTKSHDRHPQDR